MHTYGIETRGIHRTSAYERKSGDFRQILHMILLWTSGAGGLSSISGYFLGPLLFGLSFKDSVFGCKYVH